MPAKSSGQNDAEEQSAILLPAFCPIGVEVDRGVANLCRLRGLDLDAKLGITRYGSEKWIEKRCASRPMALSFKSHSALLNAISSIMKSHSLSRRTQNSGFTL